MAKLDVAALRAEFSGPHELVRTSDGRTLFVRRWDAGSESAVSVLIFHGITAHSGPYGPILAEPLARAGINVFGMDLRGHGLSDGVRGDYPSSERLVSDLSETVAFVRARSHKLVVLGHSLGVLSAVHAEKGRPKEIDGLVLLSAGRKIRAGTYRRPSAKAVLKSLIGVALLRGTPLIEFRREGMVGLADPLFNFEYSARFYSAMFGTGVLELSRSMQEGRLDSPYLRFDRKLPVPLLVGVGDQDEAFPVESARELLEGFDCDDKEFLVIPGARHAVFPKDAWDPLVAWLHRRF